MSGDGTVGYRLSPEQTRRWTLTRGEVSAHRCRCTVHARGAFDSAIWHEAVRALVDRHEILRTRFAVPQGRQVPLQVIGNDGVLEAECRPSAADHHQIRLALPALCCDRESLRNVVRELAARYAALCAGTSWDGGPAIQFADVAEWQHELFESPDTGPGRDLWRERAQSGRFELPSLTPPRAGWARCVVSRRMAGDPALTPEALLAAWQILVHRLCGRRELVLGIVCDGRRQDGLSTALGPFARVVPLWSHVGITDAVVEVIRNAQALQDETAAWQDYFSWDYAFGNREPFTTVEFEHARRMDPFESGGVRWQIAHEEISSEPHGMRFVTVQDHVAVDLGLVYDDGSMDEASAGAILASYEEVVHQTLRHPHATVADLALLHEEDGRRLIACGSAPLAQDVETVSHAIGNRAVAVPDRIALVGGDDHVSYGCMVERASGLAAQFCRDGAGGGYVGVLGGNCPESVIAVLAVWKAGFAYVPVDPGQPRSRAAAMLRQCGVGSVVTTRGLEAWARELGLNTLTIDSCGEATARAWPPADADQVAYAIFTSGSSGRPKAVAVTHRSLAGSNAARSARYPHAHPRYLLVPALAFDSSVAVVFACLTAGGTLVVPDDGQRMDTEQLAAAIGQHDVSHVLALPSVYAGMLAACSGRGLATLSTVIVAGEECPPSVRHAHASCAPDVELHNEYGPTEATVWTTAARVEVTSNDARVSIGRPRAGCCVYVVDAGWHLMPAGMAGEICVGGGTLALGYVADPGLTADRFVPDPFVDLAGARMYRTGDLGRWRCDGTLECLGRRDRQVKIRGHRIELGEVESVLDRSPIVRRSVVVLRDVEGSAALKAYIHCDDARAPRAWADDLRRWARERLPEPMVPGAFVAVDRIPVNDHGKVDYGSLDLHAIESQTSAFVPVTTTTEAGVAEIWCDVLGRDSVSAIDNFFNIGGHSLLAARVMARVRRRFHVDLPVRALFRAPVLHEFAQAIDGADRHDEPRIAARQSDEGPLSPAQERFWWLETLAPGSAAYHVGAALQLDGALDLTDFSAAVYEVVSRHGAVRTVLVPRDGTLIQRIASTSASCWSTVDVRHLPAAAREPEAHAALCDAARRPFDLTGGPLLRLVLVRATDERHLLGIVLHHIVCDGWSVELLVRELAEAYSARRDGRPSRLASAPARFIDYVERLRGRLDDSIRLDHERYWTERLANAEVLALPEDATAGRFRPRAASRARLALSADATDALRTATRDDAVTLPPVLLAVFQVLLHAFSGQCDLVVGTPVSGRTDEESQRVVGPFLNTVLVRTKLAPALTFRELVRRTADDVLGALSHQEIPFERVVELLRPLRASAPAQLVRAWFVFDEAPESGCEFSGLQANGVELARQDVRHDLRLGLAIRGDGVGGALEYDASLFELRTIEQMARGYELIVSRVASHAEATVDELAAVVRTMRDRALETDARHARRVARGALARLSRVTVN